MIGEKLYFFEIRSCKGTIQSTFAGRDFVPDTPMYEWPHFRVMASSKSTAIAEMIAKLESLKDKPNE